MERRADPYLRALDGYEKAWGPEHTSTLNTVNNLGLLYADQGKLAEEEKMYRRALDGNQDFLGFVTVNGGTATREVMHQYSMQVSLT